MSADHTWSGRSVSLSGTFFGNRNDPAKSPSLGDCLARARIPWVQALVRCSFGVIDKRMVERGVQSEGE